MPDRSARSSVHLGVSAGPESSREEQPGPELRIVVLGDFSGRGNRHLREPLGRRRLLRIDRDNLDNVLRGLAPALALGQLDLRFGALDDFHPDRIIAREPVFQQRAPEPRVAPRAAKAPAAGAAEAMPGLISGSLLDEMVEAQSPGAGRRTDELSAFIERVTEPYLEPKPQPGEREAARKADAARGEILRAILHHPDFQALEAAWRGLALLTDRLELRVSLLDITREELLDNLSAVADLLSADRAPKLIVGNYSFGQGDQDAGHLRRLGAMARVAGGPFVAEGLPPEGQAGADWRQLRRTPEAQWIGLVLPRFLLRLPYGSETSPLESLAFEEMPQHEHRAYLWGNPAIACACAVGQGSRQIERLPLHIYQEDDESVAQPCAEVLMTETEAEALLESGFMPLASLKEQDAALLVRVQSIADPPARLAGLPEAN